MDVPEWKVGEWKCGKCGKEYSTDDFFKLKSVKMVEADQHPEEEHGYTSVCDCGYVFHKDKWRQQNFLEVDTKVGKIKLMVSTVFLELNHFGMWYETMVFVENDSSVNCYYQNRYVTKEGAIEGHKKVMNLIKAGKFELSPQSFELVIRDE